MSKKSKGKTADISQDDQTVLKADYDAFICYKNDEALYGISPATAKAAIELMVKNNHGTLLRLCVAAYNQIADTFRSTLTKDYKKLLDLYGFMKDADVNYAALNVCGAIILRCMKESKIARTSFAKNGNAAQGGKFPESEAGLIKKDMWESKFSAVEQTDLDFSPDEVTYIKTEFIALKAGSARWREMKQKLKEGKPLTSGTAAT